MKAVAMCCLERQTVFIYLDAFSVCNLRCPSCVVEDGNRNDLRPAPRSALDREGSGARAFAVMTFKSGLTGCVPRP